MKRIGNPITLTIEKIDARSIGTLIALYERAVGFYASLINVNAYHQPGVEAGKKAAGLVIQLQANALAFLKKEKGKPFTSEEIASAIWCAGRSGDGIQIDGACSRQYGSSNQKNSRRLLHFFLNINITNESRRG